MSGVLLKTSSFPIVLSAPLVGADITVSWHFENQFCVLQVQMVSSMRIGRNVNYRILDIDWCTSDKVVLASDDGCIRVLEMAMKSASYRMDEQDLTGEPGTKGCCEGRKEQ